jgi:hypothetical protein
MTIYEHFSCYTKLPIKLADVKAFILECNVVSELLRYPVDLDPAILKGGYHLYRDLAPPYKERQLIARIGYPNTASEAYQRLITVKEMLHVYDPQEATAPTITDVESLISDLLVEEAEKEIGLAAKVDHSKLLNALCILLPRDALDIIRPEYKKGKLTIEAIAEEAKVPKPYVAIALTDEWKKVADNIG